MRDGVAYLPRSRRLREFSLERSNRGHAASNAVVAEAVAEAAAAAASTRSCMQVDVMAPPMGRRGQRNLKRSPFDI